MWKKFVSSIGLNNMKVDTIPTNTIISPGNAIEGVIQLTGGAADSSVEAIDLILYMQYEEVKADSDFSWHDKQIDTISLPLKEGVKANEKKEIPFQLQVPDDAAKTDEKHKWLLQTIVRLEYAVDPMDEDEIVVR